MKRGSLIDDIKVIYYNSKGRSICFKNADIRNLLKLGKANPKDIFFDLGSGWGQIIIIAMTEFGVAKAVGFEKDLARHRTAKKRRARWLKKRSDINPKKWHLVNGDFNILLKGGKLDGESLKDATLIFYGLSTDIDILNAIRKAWKGTKGRRLLYYYNCLFPDIMPDDVNLPFFVSKFPFTCPKTEEEWLIKICGKKKSSLVNGKRVLKRELWEELSHDYKVEPVLDGKKEIKYYKRRLRRLVNRRKNA